MAAALVVAVGLLVDITSINKVSLIDTLRWQTKPTGGT